MPTEQQCSMYILYTHSRSSCARVCVCVCVCEREREHISAYVCFFFFFFFLLFVAHFDVLMTGVGGSHIKHCGFPYFKCRCSVFSMVGLNKTRNSLTLDGTLLSIMTVLYVGVLYPCHQASKCATNIYNRKKET